MSTMVFRTFSYGSFSDIPGLFSFLFTLLSPCDYDKNPCGSKFPVRFLWLGSSFRLFFINQVFFWSFYKITSLVLFLRYFPHKVSRFCHFSKSFCPWHTITWSRLGGKNISQWKLRSRTFRFLMERDLRERRLHDRTKFNPVL